MLRSCLFFCLFVLSLGAKAGELTVEEIINAIENKHNNPIVSLIRERHSDEFERVERFFSDGNLLFVDSIEYYYSEACRDRKHAKATFFIEVVGDSSSLDLYFDDLSKELSFVANVNADVLVDLFVRFKEKYKTFGKCQSGYSISGDVGLEANVDMGIAHNVGFNFESYDLGDVYRIEITPYSRTKLSGVINDTEILDIDISSGAKVGAVIATRVLGSLVSPVLGFYGSFYVLDNFDSKLKEIAEDEFDDLVYEFDQNVLNEDYDIYTEYNAIVLDLPSESFLSSIEYREMMRLHDVGGFNCGSGFDNQARSIFALLSGDEELFNRYIAPELVCKQVLPTVISSSVLL